MQKKEKVLGILGGMGPLATQLFYKMIIEKTKAKRDQDHIDMIILNKASFPDRTEAIIEGKTNEFYEILLENGLFLSKYVDVIAVPCNTAHVFIGMLKNDLDTLIIDMIEEMADFLTEEKKNQKIGILATKGTYETNLYQNALIKRNLTPVIPSDDAKNATYNIIYNSIKAGKGVNENDIDIIKNDLEKQKCDAVILGCTELSVAKREKKFPESYFDPMEILARRCVLECGRELNDEKTY